MITSLTLAALLLAAPTTAPAPKAPAAAPNLRSADEILADYIKAIGGAEALNKIKSVHLKRKLEVKGMQYTGTEERMLTASGQGLSLFELANVMKGRQGTDGKIFWSDDPVNGLRVLSGAEEEEARVEFALNGDLRTKELYQKVRSVPPPEPTGGGHWECIEMTPKLGKPATACYDAETHLRVMQTQVRATPQGETPMHSTFGDWRTVNGIKINYSEETVLGPVTMIARVSELKFDEKFPAKLFALPKAAQAAKRAKPAAEAPKK